MQSQGSIKALHLRSILARRLGPSPLVVVFEYSSVAALHQQLLRPDLDEATSDVRPFVWIQDRIRRYTVDVESWPVEKSDTILELNGICVIYLLGAIGDLGNALLAEPAAQPESTKSTAEL